MNYVMSDLHGCYDEFLQMMELINFSQDDNLVILGDVIDRGASSVKLLWDLMKRTNIRLLMGNHDWFMWRVLNAVPINITVDNFKEYLDDKTEYYYMNWMYNRGEATFNEYLSMLVPERTEILNFLNSLSYYYELTVKNQKYMLAHSVPKGFKKENPMEEYEPSDLIFTRIEKEEWHKHFYDDKILIVGHTPTFFIDNVYAGKMYKSESVINIDCGCAYRHDGGRLCCLRLEDMKEYYL